jgi:hypothetical protein
MFHFDGAQIECQQTGNNVVQKRVFPGVSRASNNNAQNNTEPIFSANNLGIVQAEWTVTTTVDQVPFNVFGVPLQMQ